MSTATSMPTAIQNFQELRLRAQQLGPKRVAVVVADDEVALQAVASAARLTIAIPVLIGDRARIEAKLIEIGEQNLQAEIVQAADSTAASTIAAQLARDQKVDILLKGHLRTDELLRAALDKQNGLRTGRLLSDVLLYEDVTSGQKRLVGITDGGLNVAPTLEHKKQIVMNAVIALKTLGFSRPRIAIMSATEAISDSVPSTIDARELTKMGAAGEFGTADVYGPLALDNALLLSAAQAKGIKSSVAGFADCLVVPNIESGNMLGKAVKYLGGSQCAHVVVGAKVPILIPSRVESVDDKVNSVAFGVIAHAR